ncbi:nucleotidyltransferase family protein [Alteromonas sp. 14N.309.X.WAT.G.H12]|uniref:nucleotidyltransferase family protein n=1 Tax=Alteromonas sp. 14N.309.X.WAT.G.H12 TaxID=3120824 RepID=UPI002FD5A32A
MPIKLAAVILAGGKSARYKGNKLLSPHPSGQTLIEYVLAQYAPLCDFPPVVVTGCYHDEISARLTHKHCAVVYNPHWSQGMGKSIARGIYALQRGVVHGKPSHVIIGTGDAPAITTQSLAELVLQANKTPKQRIASEVSGRRMSPAIFPATDFGALAELSQDKGATALLHSGSRCIGVAHAQAQWDIDTPDDWLIMHR